MVDTQKSSSGSSTHQSSQSKSNESSGSSHNKHSSGSHHHTSSSTGTSYTGIPAPSSYKTGDPSCMSFDISWSSASCRPCEPTTCDEKPCSKEATESCASSDYYCCIEDCNWEPYCPSKTNYILRELEFCNENKYIEDFKSPFAYRKRTHKSDCSRYCIRPLIFKAYYQEPIPESPIENYRIHQCEIRYFIADDTIEVYEPATFDPGFQQGRIISKQKIPLPLGLPANPPPFGRTDFYTLDHLNVGCNVEFFGKTFHICGVDDATRKIMNKMGIPVEHNRELPLDTATFLRQDLMTSQFSRPAQIQIDRNKALKFYTSGQKKLRFWAYWDDRCKGGHLRQFVLHYFLENDTIEIKDYPAPYSGRTTAFLERSKLLKNSKDLVYPVGMNEESMLILNTSAGLRNSEFMAHSYLSDRLCPGIDEKEHYTDRDLAIGAIINVYGRAFILTDCDEFTKKYYRDKYCVQNFTPLVLDEPKPCIPKMEVPPPIAIGDIEDQLANWDKLIPEPPRKNVLRAILTNRNEILSFRAVFHCPLQKVNADRRFVVNYFVSDDTIQVIEMAHPNTGNVKRSVFLSRSQVVKSGSRYEAYQNIVNFNKQDFYIENTVVLNGFKFLLLSADENTLSYMEKHYQEFPFSNLCLILPKMAEAIGALEALDVLKYFLEKDCCMQGVISATDFRTLVLELSKCSLNDHEIKTLIRGFRTVAPLPPPDFEMLKAFIQNALMKNRYDRFYLQKIEYNLRHQDPCRNGLVDRQTLRSILLGARLPIEKELLDFLVDRFPAADCCNRVDYCCVMKFLNWQDNPSPATVPTHVTCILKWLEQKHPFKIFCVNYRKFLENLTLSLKCAIADLFTEMEEEAQRQREQECCRQQQCCEAEQVCCEEETCCE